MKGGDISNGVPPRVLVHLDVVSTPSSKEVPFLRFFHRTVPTLLLDKLAMAALWRYSIKHEVVLELVAFGIRQSEMDDLMAFIDAKQAHPFRSGTVYPEVASLVSELAYRHDIVGVIDLPERGLRYGSRWISLDRI